jgi:hypothetical protein
MQTFIRATEVWVPNHDGSRLVLGTACYGDMESFRLVSEEMSFGYDEGLPGKCWAYGNPIVLKRLERSYFKRAEMAHVWGLTCGVALPVFSGDFIKAVVVMLCGDTDNQVGAIEIWHNDKRVGYDMSLLDGYYGSAELFEWRSSRTKFRKGIGLPGLVWEQNQPVLLSNLLDTTRFLRHEGALKVGLNKGIGLPFLRDINHAYVVTLLSAQGTPIARRFEIWSTTALDRHRLAFESGDCDINPNFSDAYRSIGIQIGDGAIGKAMISGIPLVAEIAYTDTSIAEMNAAQAGLKTLVALPIIVDGHLSKVVVWYF